MGKVTIVLPDELETAFRHIARFKHGDAKGRLSMAGEEAIYNYVIKLIPKYRKTYEEDLKKVKKFSGKFTKTPPGYLLQVNGSKITFVLILMNHTKSLLWE